LSTDDAEQTASGNVSLKGSDLELVEDRSGRQTVGIRFQSVAIPAGAMISSAYIQFQVDEVNSGDAQLVIRGQAADDASTFDNVSGDISSRSVTNALSGWSPPDWPDVGVAGVDQRTPNIAAVVQEIVNRSGWSSGNSLAVIITGSGERTAESFDGDESGAPLLHIEYSVIPPTPTPTNTPEPTATNTPSPTATSTPVATATNTATPTSTPASTATNTPTPGNTLTPTATGTPAAAATIEVQIATSSDDAEESASTGNVELVSSDLELVETSVNQTVGMRFQNIAIPAGATITAATIQFKVDESTSGDVQLAISGQAADDAQTFEGVSNNITVRPMTVAQVAWSPPDWPDVGAAGDDQRTPNFAAVIQEIVDRSGWSSGNSLVVFITGTGTRTAESYDAPVLFVEFVAP
jgi:hypothetical protein